MACEDFLVRTDGAFESDQLTPLEKLSRSPHYFLSARAQNRAFYLKASTTKSVFYETAIALPEM